MSSISSEEIISILKSEIENFDSEATDKETGTVIWVGDGIATVYGIEHAMYGEIVVFDNGVKGMVQDIKRTEIGCILFGKDTGIREGTRVVRTGKKAGKTDEKQDLPASTYQPVKQESGKQPDQSGRIAGNCGKIKPDS